jgi:hypothetical protein
LGQDDDGVYNDYGIDNKLLSSAQKTHTITANFIDGSRIKWDNSTQEVTWKVPKFATMI